MKVVRQPRAVETREKILGEAARLFALKGYHDTKLEEVLKSARVTTGAFFHHFGSKEELGFAVGSCWRGSRRACRRRTRMTHWAASSGDWTRSRR
jgi:AcrR family transcriptional regulator